MRTDILKPGFLVSLRTTLEGGVSYERSEYTRETLNGNGKVSYSEVVRWRTRRTTDDAIEHERAVKVRSRATNAIKRVCAKTEHGLLCPFSMERALDAGIAEAQRIADDFNAEAQFTRVRITALKARMEELDEQNTRAIATEIQALLTRMETGVLRLDAAAIRDAANRARQVGKILQYDDAERVERAIGAARKAARAIVKRVEKGGEEASDVLRGLNLRAIETARFAFLDADERTRFAALDAQSIPERLPAIDRQRFADLETESKPLKRVAAPKSGGRAEID